MKSFQTLIKDSRHSEKVPYNLKNSSDNLVEVLEETEVPYDL